jgi:hypothetical protein
VARSKTVTVFGSSRPRAGDASYGEAQTLGAELAAKGFTVCSGGYGGVMEAVSRGAKQAGGKTIGVTAKFFRAHTNKWVDQEIRVNGWKERLFELIKRGNGFVACPGGTGTLVELAVVWEMLNKGLMKQKPFVALGDFWRPVIERVREVELAGDSKWCELDDPAIHIAPAPADAVVFLAASFESRSGR